MNILISLTYYTPNISGLTYHAKAIAEVLAAEGHQVRLLTMQHAKKLKTSEVINRVQIIRAKPNLRLSKGFISLSWLWLSFLEVKRADIVHLHLPQFEGGIVAFWAKILGKRLIITYHCDIILPPGRLNQLVQATLFLANKFTLSLADVIIHSTTDYANHSYLLKAYRRKLVANYPPIPLYVSRPDIVKTLIQKYELSGKHLIGFVGRLAADKGIEYLLGSIPYLTASLSDSFRLILVGPLNPPGELAYRQQINRTIEQYPQIILQIGAVSDAELGSWLKLFDVLVLPSLNSTESFGTVQVEAMLQGTPVIASNLPGVRIPVKKTGMGLIVEPKNPKALAEAIVKICQEPQLYQPRISVAQAFSFPDTLAQYKKVMGISDQTA